MILTACKAISILVVFISLIVLSIITLGARIIQGEWN